MIEHMPPMVSIIIPLYRDTKDFRQCISECLKLDYEKKEIIVVSDFSVQLPKGARLVLTQQKQTGPAEKRDLALETAKGDLLAFIDDDAYPKKDWITKAVAFFSDKSIAAVAGPGLTPREDSFFQKLGGAFFESVFGSGSVSYRFAQKHERFVDDVPAYNLFVKTGVLLKAKGFDSKFYGGEDTKLCLKIIEAGYKILYSPKVIVYHHRRAFPLKHLKQVWNVAIHRGFFVKAFPKTSRRLLYFLPSLGAIAFVFLLFFSLMAESIAKVLAFAAIIYYLVIFVHGVFAFGFLLSLLLPIVIFSSHFVYGTAFVLGMFAKELNR